MAALVVEQAVDASPSASSSSSSSSPVPPSIRFAWKRCDIASGQSLSASQVQKIVDLTRQKLLDHRVQDPESHPLFQLASGAVPKLEANGVHHIAEGLGQRRDVCEAYAMIHARIQWNIAAGIKPKRSRPSTRSLSTEREKKKPKAACCVCQRALRKATFRLECGHASHKQKRCSQGECVLCKDEDEEMAG